MNFNLESIFDLITQLLSTVSGLVRDGITNFVPAEFQSVAYLVLAFALGYWLKEKIPLPAWAFIGTIIFLIIKYI